MSYQFTITIAGDDPGLADAARDEVTNAVQEFIDRRRPEQDITVDNLESDETTPIQRVAIEMARVLYAQDSDDDIEIYDEAKVLDAGEGVWVEAYVWVRKAHLPTTTN